MQDLETNQALFCKNCNQPLSANFCSHCGQSASTHRFSLKHILSHDFLYGVFHVDYGFFYTIKELFTRPGHSIREYIEGKRVKHFKYFTLLVLLIILISALEHFTDFQFADLGRSTKETEAIFNFRSEHPKIFLIGTIPFIALFSYLFFRKAKLNYAEHFVLNAYKASALIIIESLLIGIKLFSDNIELLRKASLVFNILLFSYATWFYFQYFSVFYKRKGPLVMRSFLCVVIPNLIIIAAIIIIILIHNDFSMPD